MKHVIPQDSKNVQVLTYCTLVAMAEKLIKTEREELAMKKRAS